MLGTARQLSIYELDSVSPGIDEAPGLIGPDELGEWGVKPDFTDGTLEAFGEKWNPTPAASRHPCIPLLFFRERWPCSFDRSLGLMVRGRFTR